MADCEFISINPPIPLSCLNNFAGYVLRKILTCKEHIIDGKKYVEMISHGAPELSFEVDEELITLFDTPEADDLREECIIEVNPFLDEDRIAVGQKLKMKAIYIEDFLQSIVSQHSSSYPFSQLTLVPSRVRGSEIIGVYTARISNGEIKRMLSSDWFAREQLNTSYTKDYLNRMPRVLVKLTIGEID